MTRKPLTPAERGRLGGLARADKHSKEQLAAWGAPGGARALELYGRAHFARLAFRRFGRLGDTTSREAGKEASP